MSLVDTIERERSNFENHIAREHIGHFGRRIFPKIQYEPFHKVKYEILNRFAHGLIRKLIFSEPPQHGKSTATSRITPGYILGLTPDTKISLSAYLYNCHICTID